ncbi:hypothetical protein E2C01_067427 [Portunus trituberculatus]|uniref:Uncharacterized protein n=1 Tax=Portunus trituberculatus TaxID=210409 RepID=A0A5B7HTL0_PORTR|nr:hypothetical protein [Portunus trituberculatus]
MHAPGYLEMPATGGGGWPRVHCGNVSGTLASFLGFLLVALQQARYRVTVPRPDQRVSEGDGTDETRMKWMREGGASIGVREVRWCGPADTGGVGGW